MAAKKYYAGAVFNHKLWKRTFVVTRVVGNYVYGITKMNNPTRTVKNVFTKAELYRNWNKVGDVLNV